MSKITDIIKNPSIIGKYINGVIHAKRKKEQVYQLLSSRKTMADGISTSRSGRVRTPTWPW